MQQQNGKNDTGVSEVVGEMLIIGIVLILVALFSASLADYLPSERSPSVTIRMSNDNSGNITLWHKGGDWVKADLLRILVMKTDGNTTTYTIRDSMALHLVPDADAFDLESNITVIRGEPLIGNESITLATDRAVLFSGTIGSVRP